MAKKTNVIDGEVCELIRWTDSCSGCFEVGDYMQGAERYAYDDKAECHVGSGCPECGYTGKRRNAMWVPVEYADAVSLSQTVRDE